MFRKTTALVSLVLILLAIPATAREIVSIDKEFGVLRDFADLKLRDLSRVHAFIDQSRFVVPGFSDSDNKKLQNIAAEAIGAKIPLVADKQEANYLIRVYVGRTPNYAIRNFENHYSRGFVVIALCKLPVTDIPTDCENLQYDHFRPRDAEEVLRAVIAKWLATIVETQ